MITKELIEALNNKRELLKETITRNNMDLGNQEVLDYSMQLDELILIYSEFILKETFKTKVFPL